MNLFIQSYSLEFIDYINFPYLSKNWFKPNRTVSLGNFKNNYLGISKLVVKL